MSNPSKNELNHVTMLVEEGKFNETLETLKSIVEEDNVDQKLLITAILDFVEVLASKQKTKQISNLVSEIKSLVDDFLDIARERTSLPLLVRVFLLRAKLAALERDISNARILLVQAQILAVGKNLQQLVSEIALEYKKLVTGYKTRREDPPELEWLEKVVFHLEQEKKKEIQSLPGEKPVMFIIQSKEGVILFSRTIDSEFIISEKVIGGFLTAASTFSNEIFSKPLDFIKIAEFNLITKAEQPLVLVYVSKGDPEPALNTLIRFTRILRILSPTWEAITGKFSSWKPLIIDTAVVVTLERLIWEIFLTTE